MYSYEDRIRAVRLYIKLGKRTGATILQLGYPTKNALKSWHREYEQGGDLPVGHVRSRSKYSAEQKRVAVEHYLNHDRCIAGTRKALGYPCRDTLAAWIDELHPETRMRVVGKAAGVVRPPEVKQAAVIELCMRQVSAQAIAQNLAVSRPTLYKWKNQLLGPEAPASMKRNNDPPPASDQAELQQQVESLRRDIRQLQMEHDILKKANELIKKGLGVDLQLLSNREKTLLVDALRQTYELSELLVELDMARSSYFYHQARLRRPDKYADARLAITDVFERNHRCYGYRRIRAALGRQQFCLSEKVIRRLMTQECLVVAATKRRRYGSYLGEISPAPENLINRDFHAVAPNEKWLTDITEFHIPAGKVYLSVSVRPSHLE
jgi:putative transposase